ILEHALDLLHVDSVVIQQRISALLQQNKLYGLEAMTANQESLGPACQRPALAGAEKRIAGAMKRIERAKSAIPSIKIEAAIAWAQDKAGFNFALQQEAALTQALQSKVAIITGGPGTGKTTILRAIVDIARAKRARIQLASPTGRAAQRLTEATGFPASTIHRLLKYDGATRKFVHDADNPLPCDLLIVDEASMLDCRLAANLFDAVPSAAHLLLVGDADQLPSVGSGNVLGDLMTAPPAQVTRLDTIFRQGETSGIISTAHAILKGESHPGRTQTSLRSLDDALDFTFIEADDAEQCAQAVSYLAREYLPKVYSIDPISDVQVLSPMHRGVAGIAALNARLQEGLNDSARAQLRLRANPDYTPAKQTHFREKTRRVLPADLAYGATTYRIGDKVIQTRNNYDKGIFNGDTGIIKSISSDRSGLTVEFTGESVEFTKGELGELQLAYAISIHKSQGSEYPIVIIPLLKQHYMMLQRNLVYTGITRARTKVYLVGSVDAYAMAVNNHKTEVRRTHLPTRLRQALNCEAKID
ncbi:MAG: AAA family ATPase, partial [Verrucomicrobiota bacterium]|nr:AAA family ATPase [Verrucomicrobiota bacterium]